MQSLGPLHFALAHRNAVDQMRAGREPLSETGIPYSYMQNTPAAPIHSAKRVLDAELIDGRVKVGVFYPQRRVQSDPGTFHVAADFRATLIRTLVCRSHTWLNRLLINSNWRSAARRIEYCLIHSEPSRRTSPAS